MTALRVHDANDMMIGWKAWYGDGKIYTSKDYKWVDIPVTNIQYLKVFYDRNTDSFAGQDLYCISSDPNEIEKLIKKDSRNIKIGKAIGTLKDWLSFQDPIELEKDIVNEMI